MSPALCVLLSDGVHRNLLALSQWGIHLRQKPSNVTSDFWVSFAFEHIVNGIPALLYLATGCDKLRPTRLRLNAVATNICIELRLDVGGRLPFI